MAHITITIISTFSPKSFLMFFNISYNYVYFFTSVLFWRVPSRYFYSCCDGCFISILIMFLVRREIFLIVVIVLRSCSFIIIWVNNAWSNLRQITSVYFWWLKIMECLVILTCKYSRNRIILHWISRKSSISRWPLLCRIRIL